MKTLKMFEGVRIETEDETENCKDMTVFDIINCTDEQKTDIIRMLLINGTIDLSKLVNQKCILTLY
jgi:hypothetical protein